MTEHIEAATPHDNRDVEFLLESKPADTPRGILDGNFTIWWLVGSVFVLWFTIYKGMGVLFGLLPPPSGNPVGPIFAIHLTTASLFTWICIFNVFHSPSHGRYYRSVHIVLGRMAMIAGLLSFVCGVLAAWWERYNNNLPFSIGNTFGGVMQVGGQLLGWYQIRRKDVKGHKISMILTFYYGCLIPMWTRFPMVVLGYREAEIKPWVNPMLVASGLIFGQLGLRAALANRWI
ncbi:Aste57867_23883 [Aphanomyces stellatus]|uniref:Aste57867_23883 protein n=1 Tax=Aphanomyces stellatus TaxID=120398 RepID=A0A485LNX3_9STRA|nr:hypothetical protein As57867_023810 [Aphanomyces stellatus]VFU00526.1 Aste57867_23883 [Aphanomyces stellatus]